MDLNKVPKVFQAACLYISRPVLEKMGIKYEMQDIYRELQLEPTSVLSQVRQITRNILTEPKVEVSESERLLKVKLRESLFLNDIFEYQVKHPGCWVKEERHQMSDGFKTLLLAKKEEHDLEWGDVSRLLGIPEDTLKKVRRQSHKDDNNPRGPGGSPLIAIPDHIVETLSRFFKSRSGKATVKDFTEKHPEVLVELSLDYRGLSQLLLHLGYVSPKGIFLNNKGLDKINRFIPNAVWGTDGKVMKIEVNGQCFRWVWQCLIEYRSTVLVGGLIGESETTENLLKAIIASKEKTGISPMAIVLDNRLSENLPAIRAYLNELGIEIIKTFPGNSKSNGIIENNFKVFEQWVMSQGGSVKIKGRNAKELSLSIAELLVEVFTQLRNFAPRKSLGGKSAIEVKNSQSPATEQERSTIQELIKAMANRFKNEMASPIMTEAKKLALERALEELNPPSPEVFKKRLMPSYYTAELILQALVILKNKRAKNPEKIYDHTYFGGILRNLVDQEKLECLSRLLEEEYRYLQEALVKKIAEKNLVPLTPSSQSKLIMEECLSAKIPVQVTLALVQLKNILLFIAGRSFEAAYTLCTSIKEKILKTKMVAYQRREKLLRKLAEFENKIRLYQIGAENLFQNIPKVFSPTAEQKIAN